MKNAVTHLKAARARRPREQHIKVETRKLDEVLKGIDELYDENIRLQNVVRERDKAIAELNK